MDEQKKNEQEDASPITRHASSICASCDEYLAGWKRAQADYQNLRKEVEKERVEFVKYANERLLHDLLPSFDPFETAMKHAPEFPSLTEAERKTYRNWLQGLQAVRSLWEQTLRGLGLERIVADGAFDPRWHEAVGEEPAEEKNPGDIVRVIHDGWRWGEKVLRPARVIVAKKNTSGDSSLQADK